MTPGHDPYDVLREQLVRSAYAHDAAAEPENTRRRESRRRRALGWASRHTLLAILAGTAVTATATAAVVTGLRGTPSSPLKGRTISSAGPDGRELSAGTYRIAFSPSSGVGFVGWCSTVVVIRERREESGGGGGCMAAPTTRWHLAASGFVGFDDEALGFFVVDPSIGGLRLSNGRVVLPLASPDVPRGWRVIAVRSGDPRHGLVFDNRDFARWQLLDRDGVAVGPPDDSLAERPGRSVGEQASARRHGDAFPVGAPCRIDRDPALRWPGRPGSERELRYLRGAPRPTAGLNGQAFLPCASIGVSLGGPDTVVATVLLDAADPGARPEPLPGMTGPDDGTPVDVTWSFSGGSMGGDSGPMATAQRRGNAWLVVSGDSPKHRRDLLERLEVDVTL